MTPTSARPSALDSMCTPRSLSSGFGRLDETEGQGVEAPHNREEIRGAARIAIRRHNERSSGKDVVVLALCVIPVEVDAQVVGTRPEVQVQLKIAFRPLPSLEGHRWMTQPFAGGIK